MEKMKKMKEMEKMKLPPDGQRCCQTNGSLRCKNFRMSHCAADGSVPKTKFCEKHYNYAKAYKMKKLLKKNTSADGDQDAGSRGLKRRRKKVPGKDDETEIQQGATTDDTLLQFQKKVVLAILGGRGNMQKERKMAGSLMKILLVMLTQKILLATLWICWEWKNWNWNNDEMKWSSEADMLSSFEQDPVLLYL